MYESDYQEGSCEVVSLRLEQCCIRGHTNAERDDMTGSHNEMNYRQLMMARRRRMNTYICVYILLVCVYVCTYYDMY